jgi:hypothetical protein
VPLPRQVSLSDAPRLPGASSGKGSGSGDSEDVLALVGLFTFRAGSVLAAVTEAEQV